MRKKKKRQRNVFTPRYEEARARWIIQWPAGRKSRSGKPVKDTKTFKTKQEADAFAVRLNQEFRDNGRQGQQQSPQENGTTNNPEISSANGGITLRQAVERYIEGLHLACKLRKGGSLKGSKFTVKDLAYANQSENTIKNKTAPYLIKLVEKLDDISLQDVDLDHLNEYLSELDVTIQTINDQINLFKRFFVWCIDAPQKYIRMSPASGLKSLHCEWDSPEFYDVSDVETLFRTAEIEDPQILFDLALRFFAGMRSGEIAKMNKGDFWWDDFSINVRKEVAKKKSPHKPLPRIIENLPDTFWDWMLALGGEDFVFDLSNRYKRIDHIFQVAGVKKIHNGGRKSFATYGYALTGGASNVCAWTGHRQEKTFHDNYKGLVRQQEAKRYFAILPSKSEITGTGNRRRRHQRKIDWPSVEEVQRMVKAQGYSQTGRILGVSDNAVRKFLRSAGT